MKTIKGFKSLNNLKRLDMASNNLNDISVLNEMKSLRSLFIVDNDHINLKQIEDMISNCSLRVSTEALKTINNCSPEKITKLILEVSNLTELPNLERFYNLQEINLSVNPDIKNFNELEKISSLQKLGLVSNNLHGKMIDFTKLVNLNDLDLRNNSLWTEDLENLKALKNNTNLSIDSSNNSIIDATALLELNSNTKINLKGNVNLSQDSKDKLIDKFGNNVTF